jgi:hypothetical protein
MEDRPFFLLAGGALVVVGIILLILRIWFVKRAATTQGTVIRNDESTDSEGTTYHPVISFVSADNQTIEFSSHVGSNPPRYGVGEIVPIKYLPKNPHRAHIGTRSGLWLFPIGALVLGVGSLIAWYFIPDPEPTATSSGTTIPTVAPQAPRGQTRLTVVPKSGAPRQAATSCSSIRESRGSLVREVELRVEGETLGFTANPYTGPSGYPVPLKATVRGTIFGSTELRSINGAIVFQATGQNGVVNLSSPEITISGSWDCTMVELQKSD